MIETLTPRLLINRPSDAVVMPLPTDETTPPVMKTYLGMAYPFPCELKPTDTKTKRSTGVKSERGAAAASPHGVAILLDGRMRVRNFDGGLRISAALHRLAASLSGLSKHDFHSFVQIGLARSVLVQRLWQLDSNQLGEAFQRQQILVADIGAVLHRNQHLRFEQGNDLGRLLLRESGCPADRHQQNVRLGKLLGLLGVGNLAKIAQVADHEAVHLEEIGGVELLLLGVRVIEKGAHAGHEDIVHLILARTVDDLEFRPHHAKVGVGRVVARDGHDIRVLLGHRVPGRSIDGIGDHGRFPRLDAEAVVTEPFEFSQ